MNHTALITGASKRIGKAMAKHLSEKGWNIAIHYNHSKEEAEELLISLAHKYPKQQFKVFKAGLANFDDVSELIPTVISEMGNISLLINNASVFEKSYLKDTQSDLFDRQMEVNFKAPFFLMRDFANNCKRGNNVNFVDTRVTSNKSNFAAYSLSKKALWELTKMAALELAPVIRVNAIAPGVSLTPDGEDDDYLWKLAENIPMKKPGGLEPILKSLDFILENVNLTGQLLFADGGENLGNNA